MMRELSGDPYEGARRAYLRLNPDSTDQDWAKWVADNHTPSQGSFDNFKALALLCRDANDSDFETEPRVALHIAYSAGCFEIMERMVDSMLDILPISNYIPHHEQRFRRSLVNPNAQFY